MKKRLTTIAKVIFFLGLGVFFIWIFVRQLTPTQIDEIFVNIKKAKYEWLLVSLFFGVMSHFARAVRSTLMLEPMGYKPSVANSFYAVMVGYLANLAVPRLGEVLRCTFLHRYEKIPFQKTFGTIIAERAIDMFIFLLLFLVAFWMEFERIHDYVDRRVFTPLFGDAGNSGSMVKYIILAFGLLILVLWFIFRKKLRKNKFILKLEQIGIGLVHGVLSVTRVKKRGLFLFYTFMIWAGYFLMTYVCFFAFDGLSDLSPMAAFTCLVFGTVAFMLVQGGIGLYPVIIAETLSLYGAPETLGYAAGWVGWSVQEVMIIIFGVLSLVLVAFNKKTHNEDKHRDIESADSN